MRSVHNIPEDVRPQVHIKSFSVGSKAESASPVKHGDFSSRFMFWEAECWKPEWLMKIKPQPQACVYSPD
jgi:hypothetical protein